MNTETAFTQTLTAFALAPVEDGGLGLDEAAAAAWVEMWPQRLCLAWKSIMVGKIRRWQEQAARLELQSK